MAEQNQTFQENDVTISIQAEQSVLGCIIVNNDAIIPVSHILVAEDFSLEIHRLIYQAMLDLFSQSIPMDMLTIKEKIKNLIDVTEIESSKYIGTLPSSIVNTKNVEYYARIVKDKSSLRQIISASKNIIQDAHTGKPIENVLEFAEKSIFDISQEKEKSSLKHIKYALTLAYEEIEQNYKNKERITGVPTGFHDLDYMTSGLQKTDLIIIGARPATGKTAFALNLARNAAKADKKVAIFSLEMSQTQLVQRILSAESKVELQKIKTGDLEEDDWLKLIDSMSIVNNYPIFINDTAASTLLDIRSECRKLKMQRGLDMVIIDYLQLMQGESNTENRQQEISKISRGLKILAKEIECPIIALSQLSRALEARSNHRPMLSDIRESGAIEQDADIVMFLHRDEILNVETEKKNVTEVILAKHRSGEIGTVELVWSGKHQLFLDLERY